VAGRRNVYQGTASCYALKEGVWVPGSGEGGGELGEERRPRVRRR
jgi:hypothetical protein